MALGKVKQLGAAQQIHGMIVDAILEGEWPPGTALPNERDLAVRLGVTRPTLRETLKQLAAQGWLKIRHGKPTKVADYWREGGLAILGALAGRGGPMPEGLVEHLLQVRQDLLPAVAQRAARRSPKAILEHLAVGQDLGQDPERFAIFDWELQTLLARESGNPVYALILNDFRAVFAALAPLYYKEPANRRESRRFYQELAEAIHQGGDAAGVVRRAMRASSKAWRRLSA